MNKLPTTTSSTKNWLTFNGGPMVEPEAVDYSTTGQFTFIDEFGSIAKEVRHFRVEYDISPALSAYIFLTNEDRVDTMSHVSDGFRSEFFLINRARELGVVNGEDTHEVEGETVTQQIAVYGLVVKREEEVVKTFRDEQSIRARGLQELELSSNWIQRDEQANEVGQYIVGRWAEPADIINVSITPNPALQNGDIVSVEYPSKGLHQSTHKYHIISITLNFDAEEGMSQELKLRRFRS